MSSADHLLGPVGHIGDNVAKRPSDVVPDGAAIGLGQAVIDAHVAIVPVDNAKSDGRRIVNGVELRELRAGLLLARRERRFGLLSIGDVGGDADHPTRQPLIPGHHDTTIPDPQQNVRRAG